MSLSNPVLRDDIFLREDEREVSMAGYEYPGIVANAILLTVGILLVMLFMYTQRIIKVTQGFISFVVLCTLAIALVPLVDFILNFFGLNVPYIHETGLLGIGISLFVVIIAALNLLLDFHFIEEQTEQGAPKYMEWYGAFGLLVTLVWLYVESWNCWPSSARRTRFWGS
jgi:uncharacterized YccA/Bax inhibitor family protein